MESTGCGVAGREQVSPSLRRDEGHVREERPQPPQADRAKAVRFEGDGIGNRRGKDEKEEGRERGESQEASFCGLTWTFLRPPQCVNPHPPTPLQGPFGGFRFCGWLEAVLIAKRPTIGPSGPPTHHHHSTTTTPPPRVEERGGRGERFTPTERERKLYSSTEAT